MSPLRAIRYLSAFAFLGLTQCGPGAPSCPDGGTALTYESFGAPFMTTYCIQCHGTALSEKGVTLHTAALVRQFSIQANLSAGVGTSMPPSQSLAPTTGERADLAQWLSCGAP